MKKYRLKQWYPSLLKDVRVGDIITENGQHYKGVTYKGISYRVEIWQLHPDFWELIEEQKPLFITEDGEEVFDSGANIIAVNKRFEKLYWEAYMWEFHHSIHHKVFKHESNANGHIWRNKPLICVKDVIDNCENLSYAEKIELIKLAKERSKGNE